MTTPTPPADPLARLPGFDTAAPALELTDLHVEFHSRRGVAHAVDGVSYRVERGRTLAVIGESGSGKSMTARAVMGILPRGARITGGSVRLGGVDLLTLDAGQRRRLRGPRIAMVFQDSLSALNPALPVGVQIAETYRTHRRLNRHEAHRRAVEMLDKVRIPSPQRRARDYPHQFSGGMRQRVVIAMALALDPDVLIADEPTTALDVTVQAQIMELLAEMQQQRHMALILISHDLGVVAGVADEVAVMYAGRIVEAAPAADLYATPRHPYTRALLAAIPRHGSRGRQLTVLQGTPPDPLRMPEGCPLRPRCPYAGEACHDSPPLYTLGAGRSCACHTCQEEAITDD
ncbi:MULTISPECIES: ABC transporter ATP-binding protein [Streptomyces]|uniref:ABC transporter ATP-binding protein n=1 Tax=Streptomyces TaxID=1883 RepID=UPI001367D34C|nr:ABC transporter ATP-binding protein [Streptomyces sp. SID2888]MYV49722.1 ATP-binding cassette domain-containing protein [Streptomyces sp. SID2888]